MSTRIKAFTEYKYMATRHVLLTNISIILRGRLQRTSGKWGGEVVLKFRTFPDGGRGVVCESSDVRKFLKNYYHNCFLNISQSSITVSVVLF